MVTLRSLVALSGGSLWWLFQGGRLVSLFLLVAMGMLRKCRVCLLILGDSEMMQLGVSGVSGCALLARRPAEGHAGSHANVFQQ